MKALKIQGHKLKCEYCSKSHPRSAHYDIIDCHGLHNHLCRKCYGKYGYIMTDPEFMAALDEYIEELEIKIRKSQNEKIANLIAKNVQNEG